MARRRRRFLDPADDPELIASAFDLARQGEIAFLDDVADAALTLVPNRPMPIHEWARRNCVIPAGKTTRGGPVFLTAIQRAVCQRVQDPRCESFILIKGPRLGASTLSSIMADYYWAHEQCDVLIYERSVLTAQAFSKDKLMPIIRASVSLRALLRPDGKTGEQDTWDNREFLNGASLKFRSIHNDDSFKGIRGRFIVCEEVGDEGWQAGANSKEGSKINRLRRRGQEFSDGKIFMSGTPTIVGACLATSEYEASDRALYMMDCPHCGHRQPFEPDVRRVVDVTLRYGAGLRYTMNERSVCDDAWYECANLDCTAPLGRIDETFKVAMLETGEFEATCVGDPGKFGGAVWLAHSEDPKATWRHIGQDHHAKFVNGAEQERQEFTNLVLGKAYSPVKAVAVDPSTLQARAETWNSPDGEIVEAPAWAEALYAGIDNQQGSLHDLSKPPRSEIVVHAVGANRRRAVVAHVVVADREVYDAVTDMTERVPVEPFTVPWAEAVWDVLRRDWRTEDGKVLRIRNTFVDNGWRPDDAQRFCLLPESVRLGVIPIRGSTAERSGSRAPVLPADLKLSRSKRSGRQYLYVGTQAVKDTLGRILQIPAPAPESVVFAADLSDDFYAGLLAEHLVEVRPGVRVWKPISASNTGEALDCLVYSYAAERYDMRRNARLRKIVDAVDPEAEQAALIARMESAAQPTPVPAPEKSEPLPVQPEPRPASDGPRYRVVTRAERLAASRVKVPTADEQKAVDKERRMARLRRRQSRNGVGW